MGTKLQELRNGCFARAMDDEPMFVLLGRDLAAPDLIRFWAFTRENDIKSGKRPATDMAQIQEARDTADRMEQWRKDHDGEWRNSLFAKHEQLIDTVAKGMDEQDAMRRGMLGPAA